MEDAKFLSFGCAVTIASASVLTETIKGKEISKLFWGADEEVVQRLVSLIESELGEIPPVKLHCPPATRIKFKSQRFDSKNIRILQEGRRERMR